MPQPANTPTLRALLALAALVAGAGCGSSPPPIDKQLETLASWTATMQLATRQHRSGAITSTYATQLRDDARSALETAEQSIGESAHTRDDSSHAAAALDSLRGAIGRLNAETRS